MKILSAKQIHRVDAATTEAQVIPSIDLMERAANAFVRWFTQAFSDTEQPVAVMVGTGNNGGDGLAIARLLSERFYTVEVYITDHSVRTPDARTNLDRLHLRRQVPIHTKFATRRKLPPFSARVILIDALFGSGLNKPLEDEYARLASFINQHPGPRVAVDVPSGMFADKPSTGISVHATHTVCLGTPKLAFMFPENQERVGQWVLVDIGLDKDALSASDTPWYYQTAEDLKPLIQFRPRFAHKGNFGHALLVAGSYGKAGAALLGARACLRSGCGLVTVHVPRCAYEIMQIGFPEAMVSVDEHEYVFTQVLGVEKFTSIGIGLGLGTTPLSGEGLRHLLETAKVPLVLDADALNLLAMHPDWMEMLPEGSILTPHIGEFSRLFGAFEDHLARLERLREAAQQLRCVLVLKGAHTAIALPDGSVHFNSSGNAGMATAGSGDVLTGVLLSLLTQGYAPEQAARLGVYLHGLAGDLCSEEACQESLIATDIIEHIGLAFKKLRSC